MERIRKALDLARQERVLNEEHLHEDVPRPDVAAVPAPQLPATIVYTRTREFMPPVDLLERHRIPGPAATGPAAAAFRMLRTQVLQRMSEHGWRTLAVLSPAADDGKTTTAINLALSLAADRQHTVLLVDLDLRRPGLASAFGLTPDAGVDDVLNGRARIEDCLYHPAGLDRLVLLPARAPLAGSSEALAGTRCQELVAELRARYSERLILFDLPPVLGSDDAVAFVPHVESALVVAAEGRTRRSDLLRCMELLRRVPIVGSVLNRASDVAEQYD
jgi:Mrp family chromosome partitioning ATPase